MDLSAIKPVEHVLDIVHPGTNEPLGIKVSLLSLDDDAMKKVKRKIQDASNALARKGKSFSAEQVEENHNLLLFTAMTGWSWEGDANFHGEKPAFTVAMVYKVFNELPWFRDQISEKVGDTKSFFTI